MLRRGIAIVMSAGVLMGAACRPAARPAPTAVPTPTTVPTPAPTPTPVSLAAFFPPGPGREEVIFYCGNSHSLALPLVARKAPEAWVDFIKSHPGAAFLSEETMKFLLEYVTVNFGPDDPVPEIPPGL